MARSSPIASFSVITASLMIIVSATRSAGATDSVVNWMAVEEWTAEVEKGLEAGSEMERRILATASNFISYRSLKASSVPCSRRGLSYYNCRPNAEANPYSHGCSTITRCRS